MNICSGSHVYSFIVFPLCPYTHTFILLNDHLSFFLSFVKMIILILLVIL